MRLLALPLAACLITFGLSSEANAQAFTLDIDESVSVFSFSGTTNVGPIVGTPPTFQIDGSGGVDVTFDCNGLPVAGRFTGGDAFTIPNAIGGEIPNPLPFLPPLATLTINNLRISYESSNFPIGPDGTYTVTGSLLVLSGTVDFVPLIGDPGTIDIAGFTSDPSASTGSVVVSPTDIRFMTTLTNAIPIDSPDAGVTGTVDLNGTLDATGPRTATFCDSFDGALASCPCGNAGDPESGCDIPQATGGIELTLSAKSLAPLNRATLSGCGFPTMGSPTSIPIRAPSLEANPVVFGDGLRCISVPLVRLTPAFANSGAVSHVIGHGAMAGAGQFYYQLWFRSTPITFCDAAAAFNLSNGITVTWP